MKRIAIACGVLASFAAGAAFAAAPQQGCCACLVENGDEPSPALFCVSPADAEEQNAAALRCEGFPNAQLVCLAQEIGTTLVTNECVAELRLNNVVCPGIPAAPAFGNLALLGVTGLLGTLGMLTLRRRATRRG